MVEWPVLVIAVAAVDAPGVKKVAILYSTQKVDAISRAYSRTILSRVKQIDLKGPQAKTHHGSY